MKKTRMKLRSGVWADRYGYKRWDDGHVFYEVICLQAFQPGLVLARAGCTARNRNTTARE